MWDWLIDTLILAAWGDVVAAATILAMVAAVAFVVVKLWPRRG